MPAPASCRNVHSQHHRGYSALEYFDIGLKSLDSKNVPSLMGKAIIAYEDKNYSQALDWSSQVVPSNTVTPL